MMENEPAPSHNLAKIGRDFLGARGLLVAVGSWMGFALILVGSFLLAPAFIVVVPLAYTYLAAALFFAAPHTRNTSKLMIGTFVVGNLGLIYGISSLGADISAASSGVAPAWANVTLGLVGLSLVIPCICLFLTAAVHDYRHGGGT